MKAQAQFKFHLKNLDQLRSEIERLKLDITLDDDFSPLVDQLDIGDRRIPNRFCVQPIEGSDAESDGSPGPLTYRRYQRYAQGGFGLIWMEAIAVLNEARSNPAQLLLTERNVEKFAELVKLIRQTAFDSFSRDIVLVIQLTHSGRYCRPDGRPRPVLAHHSPELDARAGITADYPLVTDEDLDRLQHAYLDAAQLAAQAGFDGVDVKSCHGDLISGLLASFTRGGKYGGPLENRTRFLQETLSLIKENVPRLFLTTRMSGYDAVSHPYGFGVDSENSMKHDLTEPIKLVQTLKEIGIPIINITTGIPFIGSKVGMSDDNTAGSPIQDENHLAALNRIMAVTQGIQKAFPDLPVVGGSFSLLRQFIPYIGAGAIKSGSLSVVGIGRGALAYPDLVKDILETGRMEPAKCCIACSACLQLLFDGGRTGCVIKDDRFYGHEYRTRRHFALDNLKNEARRCHSCETASCSEACPAHIDVPGFIKAYESNDIKKAYNIIRQSNVLPEMCSQLCPVALQCEGACIETTLSANPIPIRDIQYVICRLARNMELVEMTNPQKRSERKIAIVGGGPAGVACAIKLLEKGHDVFIIEKNSHLGGTPETVIPASRFAGGQAEMMTVLKPALDDRRLEIQYGTEIGKDVYLKELREKYDAVFLATGLWQESSLGKAEGVFDALSFLKKAKSGELKSIPDEVAILSGGDSAMDAAVVARNLGAVDLYAVYEGTFSDMHWHMSENWFRANGNHLMSLTKPIQYVTDKDGKLTGLKICRTETSPPDASGTRSTTPITNTESTLQVRMVIEAMGLGIEDELRTALSGLSFTDHGLIKTLAEDSFASGMDKVFVGGALINGGMSVAQCVAEGMKAADEIDRYINSS